MTYCQLDMVDALVGRLHGHTIRPKTRTYDSVMDVRSWLYPSPNDQRVAAREKREGKLVVGASWERDRYERDE